MWHEPLDYPVHSTRRGVPSGAIETVDFAALVQIFFTGMRSPKDPNIVYGLLNRLTKYDIREKKLLAHAELDYFSYAVNLSRDGSRVYLEGTLNHIAIFDADDLKPLAKIQLHTHAGVRPCLLPARSVACLHGPPAAYRIPRRRLPCHRAR